MYLCVSTTVTSLLIDLRDGPDGNLQHRRQTSTSKLARKKDRFPSKQATVHSFLLGWLLEYTWLRLFRYLCMCFD